MKRDRPTVGRSNGLAEEDRSPIRAEPLHDNHPGIGTSGGERKAVELARPNFNFEKRQKEIAKKKKQEQKRLLKQARKNAGSTDPSAAKPDDASESP